MRTYVSSLGRGPSIRSSCSQDTLLSSCDNSFAYLLSSNLNSVSGWSNLTFSVDAQAGSVFQASVLFDSAAPVDRARDILLSNVRALNIVQMNVLRGSERAVYSTIPISLLSTTDFPDPDILTSRWVSVRTVLSLSGLHSIVLAVRDIDGWTSALAVDNITVCIREPSSTATRSRTASPAKTRTMTASYTATQSMTASSTATSSSTVSQATHSPTQSPSGFAVRFDAGRTVLVLRAGVPQRLPGSSPLVPRKLAPAFFDAFATDGSRGPARNASPADTVSLPCALTTELYTPAYGLFAWALETEGLPTRSSEGLHAVLPCYLLQASSYRVTGSDSRVLVTLRQDGYVRSTIFTASRSVLVTSAVIDSNYSSTTAIVSSYGAAAGKTSGLASVGLPSTATVGLTRPLMPQLPVSPSEGSISARNVRAIAMRNGIVFASTAAPGSSAIFTFARDIGKDSVTETYLPGTRVQLDIFAQDPNGLFGLVFEGAAPILWVIQISSTYRYRGRRIVTELKKFGWTERGLPAEAPSSVRLLSSIDVSASTAEVNSEVSLPAWSLTGRKEGGQFVLYSASRAALFSCRPYAGGEQRVLAYAQPYTVFRGVVLPPYYAGPAAAGSAPPRRLTPSSTATRRSISKTPSSSPTRSKTSSKLRSKSSSPTRRR